MQEELDQMNAFKVSFDDSILIFRSSGIILWQIKHMPVIKENQYIAQKKCVNYFLHELCQGFIGMYKYNNAEINDQASPVIYIYKFLTIALIVPRFFMMNFPVDSSALHVDWVMWILFAETMKVSGKYYWRNLLY